MKVIPETRRGTICYLRFYISVRFLTLPPSQNTLYTQHRV